MDEFDLIARFLRPLAKDYPEARGLEDDAALLGAPRGKQLVVTKDMLIAGVHFFPDDPPEAIAAKALRVNISDLAAKGAEPYGYFLGLGLSGREDEAWLTRFCQGLADDQRQYGIGLFGGDTVRSPRQLTLSITAMGLVPKNTMLGRKGAQPGDHVFISGPLGDASIYFNIIDKKVEVDSQIEAKLRQAYLYPQPRPGLGQGLRGIASACADISDGLAADLGHICEASEVGAVLKLDDIPLSEEAWATGLPEAQLRRIAATGGDDYQLVFSVNPGNISRLLALSQRLDAKVYPIGEIVAGAAVKALNAAGRRIDLGPGGFRHG